MRFAGFGGNRNAWELVMVSTNPMVDSKSKTDQTAKAQSRLSGLPLQGNVARGAQHFVAGSLRVWHSDAERNESLLERALLGESVACLAKAFSMSSVQAISRGFPPRF